VGELPNRAMGQDFPRFRLAADTLTDEAFDLRLSDEERSDLFTAPFFYKAVVLDTEALAGFDEVARQRLHEQREAVRRHAQAERRWADLERAGQLTPQEAAHRDDARKALEAIEPNWLAWSNTLTLDDADLTVDQLVARTRPRVMAQYDNGHAFAARRQIGKGQVVFFTSGFYPSWNNTAVEPSVILYDRVMRGMLTRSLPSRTLEPVNQITIPVRSRDLAARFTVRTPNDPEPHDIEVEALGENSYGLILRSLGGRGVYAIERQGAGDESAAGAVNVNGVDATTSKGWRLLLAMNGPSEESELGAASRGEIDPVLADEGVEARWVAADGQITLEGAAFFGLNTWVWLMLAALACLVAEMVFLAKPQIGGSAK
jgi:hypothetical protein